MKKLHSFFLIVFLSANVISCLKDLPEGSAFTVAISAIHGYLFGFAIIMAVVVPETQPAVPKHEHPWVR